MIKFFGGVAICALFCGTAFAQSAGSAALSQAGAGAQAVVNQYSSVPAHQSLRYSGSETLRMAPDVVAPSLYGGTNNCATGTSFGGSGPLFGLSVGHEGTSHECELQNAFTLLMESFKLTQNPLYEQWAVGALCASDITLREVAPNGVCSAAPVPHAHPADFPTKPVGPKVCRQVFIAPMNPDGAGHMRTECN